MKSSRLSQLNREMGQGQGQGSSTNQEARRVDGEVIGQHRQFLEETIDPDFGLLDKLLSAEVLTNRELRDVKKNQTFDDRNAKLLDLILEKNEIDRFLRALVDIKQTHIANYIKANGEYRSEFGGDWPLTKKHLATLNTNQPELVSVIDSSDLLNKLLAEDVINVRQMEFISKKPTSYEKNEALLEIVRRCSLDNYRKVIQCLVATNQSHVAYLFGLGGVLVQVSANVEGDDGVNVVETEEELAIRLAALLRNRSAVERNIIYELVELKLSGGHVGHSVALYFRCISMNELENVQGMVESGRLEKTIETVFRRLIATEIRIKLKWNANSFIRYRQYFEDLEEDNCEKTPEFSRSRLNLNDLHLEILDVILQKVYLNSVLRESRPEKLRDEEIIHQLTSVSFYWLQRITRRKKFRKTVLRKLSAFYGKTRRQSAVYRNNQQYLEETLQQSKSLVNQLKISDCLTDSQALISNRMNPVKDSVKTSGRGVALSLIDIARSFTQEQHSSFVRCLQWNHQTMVRKVIDNGGVVVKVRIRCPNSVDRESLVQNINDLQNKNKTRTHQIEKLISELKDRDIEILNPAFDRDAVVWIKCQFEDTARNLQMSDELSCLIDALSGKSSAVRSKRDTTTEAKTIEIDRHQLQKTVALLPIVSAFTARLDVRGNEEVWGVTKLKKEIWILCRPSHVPSSSSSSSLILAFESQSPFGLLQKIELKEIKEPWDMSSCQMKNCLYITDHTEKCIWMIKNEVPYKAVKWLSTGIDWPFTLSVSGEDGEVCLVIQGSPSSSLRVYGPDADLRSSVQLPSEIKEPRHVVEMTTGCWIVLHEWRQEVKSELGRRGKSEKLWVISKVSRDGQMIVSRFIPKDTKQKLLDPKYLTIKSDDQVIVLDEGNGRGILLNSTLVWNSTVIPTHKESIGKSIHRPSKVCYDEENKQLIVGGRFRGGVSIYTLNRS